MLYRASWWRCGGGGGGEGGEGGGKGGEGGGGEGGEGGGVAYAMPFHLPSHTLTARPSPLLCLLVSATNKKFQIVLVIQKRRSGTAALLPRPPLVLGRRDGECVPAYFKR